MNIVLLLPGQGSQRVGMGKDVYDAFPAAREAFQTVDDAIGASISTLRAAPDEGMISSR